uniref:SagB-type dehydrogenase domain-containing protein n=1 Tax=Candidatus Kentrum sp. FW TaxID=2126338 RepID=A0A450SH51_9GAMM|nr:MAG: SagB-type dehydrogenase domain-containing protein [Candidatus Kentron sp. FW]
MNDRKTIENYHRTTKHHFRRYAKSPGYLDWAIQPDPFREFIDTQSVRLPLQKNDESALYQDIFVPGKIPPDTLSKESIGKLFQYSLAISAWKQFGSSRWALRVNPSSGNLHPTEGYCILPALTGINSSPAVYHYAPKQHALEIRAKFPRETWDLLPPDIFLLGLSSITWREAWKYGERAFRYCQHDCGHAYMAIDIAARILGWRARLLHSVGDREISAALGLDRRHEFLPEEQEIPQLLVVVRTKPEQVATPSTIPDSFFYDVARGEWSGRANSLSSSHRDWPLIRTADQATKKPRTLAEPTSNSSHDPDTQPSLWDYPVHYDQGFSAYQVIEKRRSAVGMDVKTTLARATFYQMLLRIAASVEILPWSPEVHLALFVHRVDSLPPGLYMLIRNRAAQAQIQKATHGHFRWERPPDCPTNLPLYLLQPGDLMDIARMISCTQDIAGDSAFSLGMIARFRSALDTHGAWFYKRLLWEAGMIGQLLYLEATAAGVSGTGIGCFFDDAVHDLLGLQGTDFQSIYHFTVGGAVLDPRIATLPAYGE